ncbi:flavoprotein [Amycolatopsis sp. NPDC004079]|uniref:flavoprotein n=1 Tax=Amycolatopsis sp. NPDC004079 TaxID=3154549 RepID=UPI0033B1FC1C
MPELYSSDIEPVDILADKVTFNRMLLVGSGALSASFLPYWINWIDAVLPTVSLKVVLTRSAKKFVSEHAISALSRTDVIVDEWPGQPSREASHVTLANWADVVAVYPATLSFISRFALGLGDSPTLLALQCTKAAIGIAPALPPGAVNNPVVAAHLRSFADRPQVVVSPTEAAVSATTGELDGGSVGPLSDLVGLLERRYRELASTNEAG